MLELGQMDQGHRLIYAERTSFSSFVVQKHNFSVTFNIKDAAVEPESIKYIISNIDI